MPVIQKKTIFPTKNSSISLTEAAERSESRDRNNLECRDRPSTPLQSLGKSTFSSSRLVNRLIQKEWNHTSRWTRPQPRKLQGGLIAPNRSDFWERLLGHWHTWKAMLVCFYHSCALSSITLKASQDEDPWALRLQHPSLFYTWYFLKKDCLKFL